MSKAAQEVTQVLEPEACIALARERCSSAVIDWVEHQGGCSTTLIVKSTQGKEDWILQLRPVRYAVDEEVVAAAKLVYGELVPRMEVLQPARIDGQPVQVLKMSEMPGVPYSSISSRQVNSDWSPGRRLAGLIEDMATVYIKSLSWQRPKAASGGRVGSSLTTRLNQLSQALPDAVLRQLASDAHRRVHQGELDVLPVVLTHGDLLPSNILVDQHTWHLTALIDWAEAEWLPFGISLYGLDHLLGRLSEDGLLFTYLANAAALRAHFWWSVLARAPLLGRPSVSQAIKLARVVGILLWHGFAWDGGKIDRVVNARDEASELAFLQAFLADGQLKIPRL